MPGDAQGRLLEPESWLSTIVNGTQVNYCETYTTNGCSSTVNIPAPTEFARSTRRIKVGTLDKTFTIRGLFDVSASSATRSSVFGQATTSALSATADILANVNVVSVTSAPGFTSRTYRLIEIEDFVGTELAKQEVSTVAGRTVGRIQWTNQESLYVGMMDGKLLDLVDVPRVEWGPGVWINDTGSKLIF